MTRSVKMAHFCSNRCPIPYIQGFRPLPSLLIKKETQPGNPGSEAFFRVNTFRVRRSGWHYLPINAEAAPALLPTIFCLAVPRLYPSLVVSIVKKLDSLQPCLLKSVFLDVYLSGE